MKSSNVTINGGAGNDTIYNRGDNVNIEAGAGNDTIRNYGDSVTIDAGAGNNTIYNDGDNVAIEAGTGNDTIRNYGDSVTIDTGAGNDTIYNDGDNVTINVGTGDNYVYSSGENVLVIVDGGINTIEGENITISGSSGDDTLFGDRDVQVFRYAEGEGNDVIANYSGEDIIHIAQGKVDSYSFDGGDLIFHVGEGSLRLKNMTNHAITVKDSSGTSTQLYGTGYSQQQVIKNFVKALSNTTLPGGFALDEAIQLCSGFKSLKEVTDKMVADCRAANDAETFLRDYCGIFLDNNDTGAVLGWDNGGMAIKTGEDLIPKVGSAVYPSSTTFTKHGVTFTVPEKSTLTEQEQLVVQGFYSWWAESVVKLIEDSYGLSLSGRTINISFTNDPDAGAWGWGWADGVAVNMAYTHFEEYDKTGGGSDGLFSHEMTHSLQGIYGFLYHMNGYMIEGMADITAGRPKYLYDIAGNADILAQGFEDNSTVNGYSLGFMFWNYLMKQVADSYDSLGSYAWKDVSNIIGTSAAELLTGSGNNQTISGGSGADTITVYGKNSQIIGGFGNDLIYNSGEKNTFIYEATSGNDTIFGFGDSDTLQISGSFYNTQTSGYSGDILVNVEGGSVLLKNASGKTLNIKAGEENPNAIVLTEGNDSYSNYADNVAIRALDGKDTIKNSASNVTIYGGTGNDSIINSGTSVTYLYGQGDGNDTIYGGKSDSTINIVSGRYTTLASGSDVLINVGSGHILLKDAKNNLPVIVGEMDTDRTTITLTEGNDTYSNSAVGVKIDALGGNDVIDNYGSYVEINGGDGNDDICNGNYFSSGGENIVINGGAGDDDLRTFASYATINAGSGNDTIYANKGRELLINADSGSNLIEGKMILSTINGGTGNDNIDLYYMSSGVTINGGKGNDTLQGGSFSNIVADMGEGNDSVEIYGGSFTINAGVGNDFISVGGDDNLFADGGAGDDTIKNDSVSEATILGGAGNDRISNKGGVVEIYGGDGADSISNSASNVTISGGKGNDSIVNSGSGIIYRYENGDGDDTIFGYKSGDVIRILSGSYSTVASGNDIIVGVGSSSITLKDAKNIALNIDDELNTDTDTLPAGISISGATLTASTVFSGSEINLADFDSAVTKVNASALSRGISIVGSSAANSLKGGKKADTISGGAGNDTVSLGAGADVYIYSGGNDLIQDYAAGADKIKLASASITGSSLSSSNVVLKTSAGNITVKGAKGKNITVIDSAGKETSQVYPSESLPAGISISGAILTATAKFTGTKIDVANYSGVTKVNASAVTKNISIVGSSAANSLKAGKGADTISGGAGNDTVSLGAGNDVYIYSGGNDLIQDYKTGEDKIKLASGSISSASVSGSNVILKIGSGNITVKGAKDKNITVIDSKGKETSNVYPLETLPAGLSYDTAKKVLTVGTSYGGAAIDLVDFASTTKTVDASSFSKKIKITGNNLGNTILGGKGADTLSGGSKADSIFGGAGNDTLSGGAGNDSISGDTGADKLFGDAGNDTLSGGAGNDTLTGGDGKDVFVYGNGDGKDIIADYAAGSDKIKISSGSISSTSYSGNNVVFKIGSGTLTVQNGKGKKITITDANNKTTTQTYSGAVSGTSKLFVDDNFISNETNLDAITEKNFDVTNFSATEIETVAQEETFIVSAEK